MVAVDCRGRWRFANVETLDDKVDQIKSAGLVGEILEALFRVLEHPDAPRGLIHFEQRVGIFSGDKVARLAENWFLTYKYEPRSPVGDCQIFLLALGDVPPK